MRGTEDLGGGLKAIFALEQGFDSTDGTQAAGSAFNRMSIVGLSGGFGTVKFGRHDTSFDDIRDLSVSNNIFDSGTFATTEGVVGTTGYLGVGQLADYATAPATRSATSLLRSVVSRPASATVWTNKLRLWTAT